MKERTVNSDDKSHNWSYTEDNEEDQDNNELLVGALPNDGYDNANGIRASELVI